MTERPSEPAIDLAAASHEEQDRRLVAPPDADPHEVDRLSESADLKRPPRPKPVEREVLRQPLNFD
jgi:hypothetical protein